MFSTVTHLHVALLQQSLVAVGGRPGNVGPLVLAVSSQTFVEQKTVGKEEEERSPYNVSTHSFTAIFFLQETTALIGLIYYQLVSAHCLLFIPSSYTCKTPCEVHPCFTYLPARIL